ncbi:MAG: zinc ribbon domain-containing protein [Candidatus Dadabacteria bacterium]|nr:zinc ribbon domain-containing protein [Candidatus Dadabacteria bacterium]
MAMIECKECGKEISSKAKACPHCGWRREMPAWVKYAIFFGLIFTMVATIYYATSLPESTPKKDSIYNSKWYRDMLSVNSEYKDYIKSIDEKSMMYLILNDDSTCVNVHKARVKEIRKYTNGIKQIGVSPENISVMGPLVESYENHLMEAEYLLHACKAESKDEKIELIDKSAKKSEISLQKMRMAKQAINVILGE